MDMVIEEFIDSQVTGGMNYLGVSMVQKMVNLQLFTNWQSIRIAESLFVIEKMIGFRFFLQMENF